MISIKQAYEAYRKLKNYFYFDNTSLFIRHQIAEFEREFYPSSGKVDVKAIFEKKLDGILKVLNDNDDQVLNLYLSQIGFRYICKSVVPDKSESKFIINRPLNNDVLVDKMNMIIQAPVEIHVISVLWLMLVGVHFSSTIGKSNYAYQFMLNEDEDDIKHSGLQLYRPYYIGYQEWRDKALSTALRLLDEKKDATILSIDVKRYFYSVRENLPSLLDTIKRKKGLDIDLTTPMVKRLNDVLQAIHRRYTEVVLDYVDDDINKQGLDDPNIALLPVGLLSSGFVGNLVLCDFDEDVIEKLNPAYYGRYVDDMLFVMSDRKMHKTGEPERFIKENFVERKLLVEDGKNYKIFNHDTLSIQEEKVIVEHFYHNESRAAINKFKNNINRQRSEFRFLPDEEEIDKEFDNEAFTIQYSESINKLRSIKEYKEDKYGASKFLAHKIFLACLLNHSGSAKERKELAKSNAQILTFFKGKNCIAFSSLWEKVATYFIINNDVRSLNKFIKQTNDTIDNILGENLDNKRLGRFKHDLKETLLLSVSTPYALNLDFKVTAFEDNNEKCRQAAESLRYANMFRHNIVGILGINYTSALYDNTVNLYQYTVDVGDFDEERAVYLSPRFVHHDEINVVAINKVLAKGTENDQECIGEIISNMTRNYYRMVNYEWQKLFSASVGYDNELYSVRKFTVGKNVVDDPRKYIIIHEETVATQPNKRIGIVNMKVSEQNIGSSMWNKPVLTTERRSLLFQIINMAIKERCEILVLPELSVPFQWLEILVSQCKRHDLAIITGLEYYHGHGRKAYNCVVTILPIKTKYFTTAAVFLRVKNHYSPKEKKELIGRRKVVPDCKKCYYLFHWRKCYFSVYNCFELANINDRALFKSKADFIVATEWNPDVNYYADIAGSWVRDVHCFFIQCNTSSYGDSCIMQPSKTELSRMVTVKGGINSSVLVEMLDIEGLRNFQFQEHILQMDDKSFKMTPPDFNTDDVETRKNDDDFV